MAQRNECELFAGKELYGASFREAVKSKKLMASKCRKCSTLHFPPRPICPECHETDMEVIPVKGQGKLIAFTVITAAPPFMLEEGYNRDNPYCSGIVQLEEGVRVTARIIGADVRHLEEIKIGTPVTLEFQEATHNGEKKVYIGFRIVK